MSAHPTACIIAMIFQGFGMSNAKVNNYFKYTTTTDGLFSASIDLLQSLHKQKLPTS